MNLQKLTVNRKFFNDVNLTYKSKQFEMYLHEFIELGNELERFVQNEMSHQKGHIVEKLKENIQQLEDYSQKYCYTSMNLMRTRSDEYTERINSIQTHDVDLYYKVIDLNIHT